MNNFRIERFNDIDPSFTKNLGQKFENPVCLELRRLTDELYYYSENGVECDFVVCSKNRPRLLIQACRELHHENREREQKGLLDAMDFFGMKRGWIVTLDQTDKITAGDIRIGWCPAYWKISFSWNSSDSSRITTSHHPHSEVATYQ
jgi:predicted AAA+ superfamily ATPase